MGKTSTGEDIPQAIIWVDGHADSNDADLISTMFFLEIPSASRVTEVQYFFPSARFCNTVEQPNSVSRWLLGTTNEWPKEMLDESLVTMVTDNQLVTRS